MSKGLKAMHRLPETLTKADKTYGRILKKKAADNVMTAYFSTRHPRRRLKGCGKTAGVNEVARRLNIRYSDAVRLVRAARLTGILPGNS